MSRQNDDELSHPLEHVTGEKDVHPEDEQRRRRQDRSTSSDAERTDATTDPAEGPAEGSS
ncbi:hypothetical protein SAM23877_7566 [Streptomyces ambofaciens ATCC 23877]|uniref:Uncharacterized protein SAMT0081 n=2 Tax=Streptomyces ambofaciens TaxID=1889 RepID=Q1RR05_STRA7|nr:hypothetical protein [Streptomyces ambofaciens]AKZ53156.1 hypothetical protein SAM23877_0107 [Streptomyces ambofaciens ATCC 23877]AKZ60607.1 hypothetical protein SAM23877_7566 [Streptomyces ambofaciens ATCC 23877]ANB04050.1 hypothetical protein SAM40697_0087 [Streptomyces ambofaciens]ANB10790.1 hypothetical protein SAM40697_6838 [Streptomyces ambofaciens]CAI78010.1 unknown hypothetical protein [Streptomyces ambofaciens ATCC 23877]